MAGISDRKARLSWVLFDVATVPFFVLILLFVFGPYFVSKVAPDPVTGQAIWGYTIASAGLVVAILAPVLGAIADKTGRRKMWIAGFSILIVGGLFPLYFAKPDGALGTISIMIALGIAFVGIRLATAFNNAMLPHIVAPNQVGRYSGYGTAAGNIGGLVLIIFVLGFMVVDPQTKKSILGFSAILGLDSQSFQGERATAILSAFWFCLFVTPLMLFARDSKPTTEIDNPLLAGITRLRMSLASLPKRRSYMNFLISVMFYRNGISTLYVFGGIYAVTILELPIVVTGIFGIIAILFGAIGALIGGKLDQMYGPKRVIQVGCTMIAIDCLLFISITKSTIFFVYPISSSSLVIAIYLVAGAIAGLASNAVQAASRSLLIQQIAQEESTEAFGLYDFASRVISFIGPLSVAFVTQLLGDQRVGMLPIVILLMVGLIFLRNVKDTSTNMLKVQV